MGDREDDAILELHLHGELPAALRSRADKILSTPEGKRRWEALRESDARILEEIPSARMGKAIESRVRAAANRVEPADRTWHWKSRVVGLAGGLALAMLMVTAVSTRSVPLGQDPKVVDGSATTVPHLEKPTEAAETGSSGGPPSVSGNPATGPDALEVVAMAETPDEGTRTKGIAMPRMRIHRVEAGSREAVALRDGDSALAGTVVQVGLLAGPKCWAAVVSVDGNGQVTRHIPEQGDSAQPVEGTIQAPHSFQVDEAPGFERFLLVVAAHPFALAQVEDFARRCGGRGPLPPHPGWSIQLLRIVKPEARP